MALGACGMAQRPFLRTLRKGTAAARAQLAGGGPQHLAERRAKHENDDEGHAGRDAHEQDEFGSGDHLNLPQRRHAAAA
jgi:hypothetical protein